MVTIIKLSLFLCSLFNRSYLSEQMISNLFFQAVICHQRQMLKLRGRICRMITVFQSVETDKQNDTNKVNFNLK